MDLSITRTVAQVLRTAERPLTVDEVLARVRALRPVDTAQPEITVRNTFTDLPLVATLGGRPARYVWWPPRLLDNSFRLPLAAEHLVSGQVILNIEVRFALWPTFFADRGWRSPVVMLITAEGNF